MDPRKYPSAFDESLQGTNAIASNATGRTQPARSSSNNPYQQQTPAPNIDPATLQRGHIVQSFGEPSGDAWSGQSLYHPYNQLGAFQPRPQPASGFQQMYIPAHPNAPPGAPRLSNASLPANQFNGGQVLSINTGGTPPWTGPQVYGGQPFRPSRPEEMGMPSRQVMITGTQPHSQYDPYSQAQPYAPDRQHLGRAGTADARNFTHTSSSLQAATTPAPDPPTPDPTPLPRALPPLPASIKEHGYQEADFNPLTRYHDNKAILGGFRKFPPDLPEEYIFRADPRQIAYDNLLLIASKYSNTDILKKVNEGRPYPAFKATNTIGHRIEAALAKKAKEENKDVYDLKMQLHLERVKNGVNSRPPNSRKRKRNVDEEERSSEQEGPADLPAPSQGPASPKRVKQESEPLVYEHERDGGVDSMGGYDAGPTSSRPEFDEGQPVEDVPIDPRLLTEEDPTEEEIVKWLAEGPGDMAGGRLGETVIPSTQPQGEVDMGHSLTSGEEAEESEVVVAKSVGGTKAAVGSHLGGTTTTPNPLFPGPQSNTGASERALTIEEKVRRYVGGAVALPDTQVEVEQSTEEVGESAFTSEGVVREYVEGMATMPDETVPDKVAEPELTSDGAVGEEVEGTVTVPGEAVQAETVQAETVQDEAVPEEQGQDEHTMLEDADDILRFQPFLFSNEEWLRRSASD